jgi:hypothetical protein
MKERKPGDDTLDELFEEPDVEALYASVTTALTNAVIACRRVAPDKEDCNGLEVTRVVSRAVTPKQKAAAEDELKSDAENDPERSASPTKPQRKPE